MSKIDKIPKSFDYHNREDEIYQEWEDKKYFRAEVNPDKEAFTIMMPPPNITGTLHMGHALDTTLQDILARWRRMQGFETLYLPGTDHASIATEARVVDKLAREGKTKEQIGRDAFLEEAWAWKEEYGSIISKQLCKLGISCDWDRERFTLDEGMNDAVLQVFINLHNEGLIYRGRRMVNWCPHCVTNISDIEVEHIEQQSHLWHIRYPLEDGSGYIEVATTRPETMLGDTAVAVNPNDERFKHLIGKNVILPIANRAIPIIGDDYVDVEFGTGQLKITPAHDPNDFEIGLRHNLELVEVIDKHGIMNETAGKYQGQTRKEARVNIVTELGDLGVLGEIEDYVNNVGTCSRCGTVIEPRVSEQWFVKMEPLAKPAIDAVRNGDIKFVPEHTEKTYFNWMENIQDWTISRQLWWGHRIPAYYCQNADCGHIHVGKAAPESCVECAGTDFVQDQDTLDTWFSSALWPFSTLGWPGDTEDFNYFYPTSTMSTGTDLIFFWVARMIFSGIHHTGEIPFDTVYFHGMVLDDQGRKMSKSLDNGIDPLEVIADYGTDALRYSVVNGTAPGNNQRYRTETVEAGRAFVTKMWNAFRFVMMNLDEGADPTIDENELKLEDRWILSRLNSTIEEVTRNLENYELGVALASIYEFIWDEFCDWYIEMLKSRLFDKEDPSRETAQAVLIHVLTNAMKLLHPFMPFVSEEIYQYLLDTEESIMVKAWPEQDSSRIDLDAENSMAILFDAIRQVRHLRTENDVKPKNRIAANVVSSSEEIRTYFAAANDYLDRLAGIGELTVSEAVPTDGVEYSTLVFSGGEIYIPSADITDPEKERARLSAEKEKLEVILEHAEKMLANKNFVDRAPENVVQAERDKQADTQAKLDSVNKRLAELVG